MELERIRACVATALSDLHYLQRGILEVQLEQLRLANSGRFTDKPTRVIQMGENNKYGSRSRLSRFVTMLGKRLSNPQCC
ncbi:bacteriophage antitermination protein Q [Klebsiella michiganensis]|uniref:bacteriophage antitermination protein Q n=1 Tax=Klebsiella michiganensis TaxID=1134687 RepID=UPI00388D7D3E